MRSPLVVVAMGIVALGGCLKNDPPMPRVAVTGDVQMFQHTTSKLTATTTYGSDKGYDWSSADPTVVSVAADGTATANKPGQVVVTAKGQSTKASGTWTIVVSNDLSQARAWVGSAHANLTDEPFVHWNNDPIPDGGTAPVVPQACARCHSTPGFRDYLGDDGTTPFKVDNPAPIGTGVECAACHNPTASALSQVTFPSGVTLTGLGPEAKCETCHQGREATDTVNAQIAKALTLPDGGVIGDDVAAPGLGFKNVHYYAAAATLNGGKTRGGYQYAGQVYDVRFRHVSSKDTCVTCHDQHSLKIDPGTCATCHAQATSLAGLRDIRMQSSLAIDYDGDGNTTEGIAKEIDGLRAILLTQLQKYAAAQALPKLCYSGAAFPYFFTDTAGDGACGPTVAVPANAYTKWTARLERAAYNYQVSLKDPGAFAHNAKYIIELLFDSISDLNTGIPVASQFDTSKIRRTDIGHFDGTGQPARHWDTNESVDSSCSKCHSGSSGFAYFVQYGVPKGGAEQDNGLDCETCHTSFPASKSQQNLRVVSSALFPSNLTLKPDPDTNTAKTAVHGTSYICITCHMGRESKATLDAQFAIGKFGFKNLHYLAAGSTIYGHEAQVGYEYTGQTYVGRVAHTGGLDCNGCHNGDTTKHTFSVDDNISYCQGCHGGGLTDVTLVPRLTLTADYDGDGNATEPLESELSGMAAKVLAQMQATTANGICYDGARYPYFLKDVNGNGVCDPTESAAFTAWTAPLSKAAFNYQFWSKDPGAWAHNFRYTGELLFDSLVDLGGSTAGMTRP